jgi:hypothetical protein
MRKTRPGVDRTMMVALRAQVGNAKHALADHVRQCYQCGKASQDVYDHCAEWWSIAVELHRMRRKLRRYEQPIEANQATLPGME